jgi:mono/diheme cytochrome c family protein
MRAIGMLAVMAGVAAVLSKPREAAHRGESAPAYSPQAAQRLFAFADPAYRLELAAAEPDVTAPVAIRFDEDGRLWVVEMPSYMRDMAASGEQEPVNRISVLEDLDGDGTFETKRVFLDGLKLPRGVMPCFQTGGRLSALVIEPPSVYFAVDTDGDGRADERKPVLGGIAGLDNPEHAPNGLLYGMDNWIEFSQHNIAFKFDGERAVTRAVPSHGQWGITMDDLGRLYYTPNSDALRVDAVPKWFAARWSANGGLTGVNEGVMGEQTVWPARATPGVNRGYQVGVLREDGTLRSHTAACSPTIDRGGGLGTKGFAYVCEPAGNMVRLLDLTESGGKPRGKNAYDKREFLTSTDERFRPVATAIGPDGALYIADMYRGVIQHKTYLTPQLKAQIAERGLEQPVAMGRIWRVTMEGKYVAPMYGGNVKLSKATDERLVELLGDERGWYRDTAQRLLVERRAVGVAELIRKQARSGVRAVTRVQAFWTLEGLGVVTGEDLEAAAKDADAAVREHAARMMAGRREWADLAGALLADPEQRVVWHAALAMGSDGDPEQRPGLLVKPATEKPQDAVLRSCVVNSLAGIEIDAIREAIQGDAKKREALVADLASAVLRGVRSEERAELLDAVASEGWPEDVKRAVMGRVESVIGVGSARPRPIRLAREPKAWVAGAEKDQRMARALVWFDWPERPAVDRGTKPVPLTAEQQASFERGKVVFARNCAQCHGMEGRGVPGQTPPLAGSPRATGDPGRAIRILLHGMDGSMERDGVVYNGQMPAAATLVDTEIADTLTYVRRSWGNAAAPVLGSEVLRVRMKTAGRGRAWTVGDIDSLPEEKP